MVSIGTVFSLAAIGAIIAGGYVVYRNFDKIGGAFTGVVEKNLSNPFGDWLDSLSGGLSVASAPSTPPNTPFVDYNPNTNDPQDSRTWEPGYSPPPEKDFLPPTQAPTPYYPPTQVSPIPAPTPAPVGNIPDSTIGGYKDSFKSGYYYINYEGAKYDTQWKLTGAKAWEVSRAAEAKGDALLGIQYIGQSKLGEAGFQLFGESQNYL